MSEIVDALPSNAKMSGTEPLSAISPFLGGATPLGWVRVKFFVF